MNVVLYTKDLIPLTVVELSEKALASFSSSGNVELSLIEPVQLGRYSRHDLNQTVKIKRARLSLCKLRCDVYESWMLTVDKTSHDIGFPDTYPPGSTGRARDEGPWLSIIEAVDWFGKHGQS